MRPMILILAALLLLGGCVNSYVVSPTDYGVVNSLCPACGEHEFMQSYVAAGGLACVNRHVVRYSQPVIKERCVNCGYEYVHTVWGRVQP
jgi:predicted nucleic-acid-binding Zn-ribbon protein